ncbi:MULTISPECIES: hypothetical protein [unclassified Streptomyces]|uniref:hypothetical protein n=1 Tax=unclassified Streptomyces TaxID=2593676 RepID=UPI0036E54E51
MTTETTGRIVTQRAAFQVLADLADKHPDLPPAYITIERTWENQPSEIHASVGAPSDFSPWLAALGIRPERVSLEPSGRGSWIEASTEYGGHPFKVFASGILITQDQLQAPRTVEAVSA